MRMSKTTGLILFLLICIGLTFGIQYHEYQVSKEAAYGDAVDNAVRPLRLERQELEDKQQALQEEQTQQKLGKGVGTFIFTELRPEIYSEIYPEMVKNKLTATLAFSDKEFPGKENCISVQQYQELVAAGWSICIQWDTWTALEEYLELMQKELDGLGAEMPKVIYFQPNMYKDEYDKDLEKHGFTIVVHHGEGNHPLITRADESVIWHVASLSWNRSGILKHVNKVNQYGGAIAFNVDFGQRRSGYKKEYFNNMLKYLTKLKRFMVTDLQASREYRKSVGINMAIQSEIDWYQNEIDEINREISEIYNKN